MAILGRRWKVSIHVLLPVFTLALGGLRKRGNRQCLLIKEIRFMFARVELGDLIFG